MSTIITTATARKAYSLGRNVFYTDEHAPIEMLADGTLRVYEALAVNTEDGQTRLEGWYHKPGLPELYYSETLETWEEIVTAEDALRTSEYLDQPFTIVRF